MRAITLARRLLSPKNDAGTRRWEGVEPLSEWWGTDRGLPLHRHYTVEFLRSHAADIRGRCMEFQEDRYSTLIGGGQCTSIDVLHRTADNPRATMVGDLTVDNDLPGDCFDCIICTFVLHCIFDVRRAIGSLHRMLKPSGVLLLAVPMVSMSSREYGELWRFTPAGVEALLETAFTRSNCSVKTFGNALTTPGDLRGMVYTEFSQSEIDYHDERFGMVVCARAQK